MSARGVLQRLLEGAAHSDGCASRNRRGSGSFFDHGFERRWWHRDRSTRTRPASTVWSSTGTPSGRSPRVERPANPPPEVRVTPEIQPTPCCAFPERTLRASSVSTSRTTAPPRDGVDHEETARIPSRSWPSLSRAALVRRTEPATLNGTRSLACLVRLGNGRAVEYLETLPGLYGHGEQEIHPRACDF